MLSPPKHSGTACQCIVGSEYQSQGAGFYGTFAGTAIYDAYASVTAVAAGTTTITARYPSGISVSRVVTVQPVITSVSGPTTVTTAATYTYTAPTTGCNTTCSYAWTVTSSTGTTTVEQPPAVSGNTLALAINSTSGNLTVHVTATSQGVASVSNALYTQNNISSGGCSATGTMRIMSAHPDKC
jgi:hypothetical protein